MQRKGKRIILDTNIWISFLITRKFSNLDKLLFLENTVLFSEELLQEFLEVIKRPKFRKYFSLNDVTTILKTIIEKAEFIEVSSTSNICRDNKDNFLLSLAMDSKADYLLTGDTDLLILEKIDSTQIVTVTDFIKRINSD